jgi:hypothetical protein
MCPHWFHDLHAPLVAATPNTRYVEFFVDDQVLNFRRLIDGQLAFRERRSHPADGAGPRVRLRREGRPALCPSPQPAVGDPPGSRIRAPPIDALGLDQVTHMARRACPTVLNGGPARRVQKAGTASPQPSASFSDHDARAGKHVHGPAARLPRLP